MSVHDDDTLKGLHRQGAAVRVIEILRLDPIGWTRRELEVRLGLSERAVSGALGRLKKRGLVEQSEPFTLRDSAGRFTNQVVYWYAI